jgi:hypothetical protein
VRRFLREILTDYDNRTYDTARVLAVGVVCGMVLLQTVATLKSGTFDPQAFGVGIASVIGALGIAIAGDNHKRPE